METSTGSSGLTIGWGVVSLGLGVIALGSLGTLVVVTSIKEADTLSTVALALAILSFAAQLIVTLAQGQQTSQLNADTKSALSDMRATTSSLLTNQRDQFDKVLDVALNQAVPAAVEDVQDDLAQDDSKDDEDEARRRTSELEERLSFRLREALSQPLTPSLRTWTTTVRARSDESEEVTQRLLQWPEDEELGGRAVELLNDLGPRAISVLGRVIDQLKRRPRANLTVRYTATQRGTHPAFLKLIDGGVLEQVEGPPEGELGTVVYRVTPLGFAAAQLLSARGTPPEWAASLDLN